MRFVIYLPIDIIQAAAKRLCNFSRVYRHLLNAISQNALQELHDKDQKRIIISVTGSSSCEMSSFIHALIGERYEHCSGCSTGSL